LSEGELKLPAETLTSIKDADFIFKNAPVKFLKIRGGGES